VGFSEDVDALRRGIVDNVNAHILTGDLYANPIAAAFGKSDDKYEWYHMRHHRAYGLRIVRGKYTAGVEIGEFPETDDPAVTLYAYYEGETIWKQIYRLQKIDLCIERTKIVIPDIFSQFNGDVVETVSINHQVGVLDLRDLYVTMAASLMPVPGIIALSK